MFNILIWGYDKNESRHMDHLLTSAGYQVLILSSFSKAKATLTQKPVTLVIMDMSTEESLGLELTAYIRNFDPEIPILMMADEASPRDRCRGLSAGADDYMNKPVYEEELLLRIQTILRRSRHYADNLLTVGDVSLNSNNFEIKKDGSTVILPQKEFLILYTLLSHPNHIFSRDYLMNHIWGYDTQPSNATLNVHINRVRSRFKGWKEFRIFTIRNVGYKAEIYVQ